MKKIFIILFCLISSYAFSQPVKVNFQLDSARRVTAGIWSIAVFANVLPNQTWRVGSTNIRVDWTTTPTTLGVTVHPDNLDTALKANTNLSNNANYSQMTTTSISGGTAISLNISRLGTCYRVLGGTSGNRIRL